MTARGVRNRNPGNIRKGDNWIGLAPEQNDPDFCTFIDAQYGIRALAKVLLAYQDQHHLRTVREIINRWAPPNENETNAYVDYVSRKMRVTPETVVNLREPETAFAMVQAIIGQECAGYSYLDGVIWSGLHMAGIGGTLGTV